MCYSGIKNLFPNSNYPIIPLLGGVRGGFTLLKNAILFSAKSLKTNKRKHPENGMLLIKKTNNHPQVTQVLPCF